MQTSVIMNTIDYIGLTDIAAYTAPEHPFAAVNGCIIKELTGSGGSSAYSGLYEPLLFMNLLHSKFEFLKANRKHDKEILEHLRALELGYDQRHYLYKSLVMIIEYYLNKAPVMSSMGMLSCRSTVEGELQKIWTARYEPEKHRQEMELVYQFEGREKRLKHYDPTKDLDAYIDRPLNMEILCMLTEGGDWESVFEPLAFFKLLYRQFEITCDNRERPIALRSHLLDLGLNSDQTYLFLHFLLVLLRDHQNVASEQKDAGQLAICIGLLEREYHKLGGQRKNEGKPLVAGKEKGDVGENDKNKDGDGDGDEDENSPVLGVGTRFSLSTKFTKTDLIRLLNVIYHMRLIHAKDGTLPSKDEFMLSFAEFLGTDLRYHDSVFSRLVGSTSREANLKVFRELSENMEALIDKELKAPKK